MAKFRASGGIGGPRILQVKNKASRHVPLLPSRPALSKLLKADAGQQSMGNFAKLTPSGATAAAMPYNDIMQLGQQPDVIPALNNRDE